MGGIVDAGARDLDAVEPLLRRAADAAIMAPAHRHQPLADIGAGGHRHAQAQRGILVHVAPVGAEQQPAFRVPQRGEVVDGAIAQPIADPARGGRELRREELQQRGLARSGLADHRHHLAREEIERDVAAAELAPVPLGKTLGLQQRHVGNAAQPDAGRRELPHRDFAQCAVAHAG